MAFKNKCSENKLEKNEQSSRKLTEKWVNAWKRASVTLKEVKQRELRAFDYSKNRTVIDECCNGHMTTGRSG